MLFWSFVLIAVSVGRYVPLHIAVPQRFEGLQVSLPLVRKTTWIAGQSQSVRIWLDRWDQVATAKDKLDWSDLDSLFQNQSRFAHKTKVVLYCDKYVEMRRVFEVVNAARKFGIVEVSVVARDGM